MGPGKRVLRIDADEPVSLRRCALELNGLDPDGEVVPLRNANFLAFPLRRGPGLCDGGFPPLDVLAVPQQKFHAPLAHFVGGPPDLPVASADGGKAFEAERAFPADVLAVVKAELRPHLSGGRREPGLDVYLVGVERVVVKPRQVAMYLMRNEIKSSFPSIGKHIGGRDHTTAMHAYEKISREIENGETVEQEIHLIAEKIYNENLIS